MLLGAAAVPVAAARLVMVLLALVILLVEQAALLTTQAATLLATVEQVVFLHPTVVAVAGVRQAVALPAYLVVAGEEPSNLMAVPLRG
jgi:hypothetical protein